MLILVQVYYYFYLLKNFINLNNMYDYKIINDYKKLSTSNNCNDFNSIIIVYKNFIPTFFIAN